MELNLLQLMSAVINNNLAKWQQLATPPGTASRAGALLRSSLRTKPRTRSTWKALNADTNKTHRYAMMGTTKTGTPLTRLEPATMGRTISQEYTDAESQLAWMRGSDPMPDTAQPVPVPGFTDYILAPSTPTLLIGQPGAGKSTLAVEWALRIAEETGVGYTVRNVGRAAR